MPFLVTSGPPRLPTYVVRHDGGRGRPGQRRPPDLCSGKISMSKKVIETSFKLGGPELGKGGGNPYA